jgi:hypothetical protein
LVDTVTIDTSTSGPTLEETAAKMGIDTNNLEPTATGGQDAPAPVAKVIPEWVPEKFHGAEDPVKAMADAYKALEQKQSGKVEDTPEAPKIDGEPKAETDTSDKDGEDDPAQKAVADAGLDFDDLSDVYRENGKLDDEHYQKLEKAGIPKALVDSYIAGQEALAIAAENEVYAHVGGKDTYSAMVEFAKSNLNAAEIDAYDNAVNSANPAARRMAVDGLKARYEAVNGREPARVTGSSRGSSEGGVYESWAQVQADMGNPLYTKDPAFRSKVEAKIGRSPSL